MFDIEIFSAPHMVLELTMGDLKYGLFCVLNRSVTLKSEMARRFCLKNITKDARYSILEAIKVLVYLYLKYSILNNLNTG